MSTDAFDVARHFVELKDLSDRWNPSMIDWLAGDPRLGCPSENLLHSLLNTPLLGILASHPHRDAFRSPSWQHSLDSTLHRAKRNSQIVLFPLGAPHAPAIEFACENYGVKCLGVHVRFGNPLALSVDSNAPIKHLELWCDTSIQPSNLAADDLGVCILADQLLALKVSPSGKIASILERRLRCEEVEPSSLWIRAEQNPSKAIGMAQKHWSQLGAVLWFADQPDLPTATPWSCSHRRIPATLQLACDIPNRLASTDNFLIHTTRTRQTLWPNQSERDLLDEAFRLEWNPSPSPLDTLLHIVTEQKLVATTARKRGDLPSISFTENPIGELVRMRSFQSHLARWDWEPYGIAIRRTTLENIGCRRVRYLHKPQIDQLDPSEQTFCQPLPSNPGCRDWTVEKEWRLASDLRLAHIPPNDAFLLVAHVWQAKLLAHYSRWPVYALEPLLSLGR